LRHRSLADSLCVVWAGTFDFPGKVEFFDAPPETIDPHPF